VLASDTLTSTHRLLSMLNVKVDNVGDFWALRSIHERSAEERCERDYNECERDPTEHCKVRSVVSV